MPATAFINGGGGVSVKAGESRLYVLILALVSLKLQPAPVPLTTILSLVEAPVLQKARRFIEKLSVCPNVVLPTLNTGFLKLEISLSVMVPVPLINMTDPGMYSIKPGELAAPKLTVTVTSVQTGNEICTVSNVLSSPLVRACAGAGYEINWAVMHLLTNSIKNKKKKGFAFLN